MSERISRRQVLAAIALQADLPAPQRVEFAEGDRTAGDPRISIYLDSVADLHAWLSFFGMTTKRVTAQPYTYKEGPHAGQTTTLANALSHVNEGWRGWRVHLSATDPVGEPEPALDNATREQLRELAGESDEPQDGAR